MPAIANDKIPSVRTEKLAPHSAFPKSYAREDAANGNASARKSHTNPVQAQQVSDRLDWSM
jgi:hypothetical protein